MVAAVPIELNHIKARGTVRITWDDGHVGEYQQVYVRGHCRCAMCQGHGTERRFVAAPNAVLVGNSGVRNYPVQLHSQHGHSTRIYSSEHLHSPCPCDPCERAATT